MPSTSLVDPASRPSRILRDVAEGWLEDDELEAVATWLEATAPTSVPEDLVEIGLRARHGTRAQVA